MSFGMRRHGRRSPHGRQHLSDPHQTWGSLNDLRGVGSLSCTTETLDSFLDKSKWHQAAAIDGMCHWQLPATVEEFLVDARKTEDNETILNYMYIYHIQKHAQKQTKCKPNEKSKNIQALLNLNQFDLSLRMPLFHLVSVIRSLFPVPFDFPVPVTP